jgi:hypothetical protein
MISTFCKEEKRILKNTGKAMKNTIANNRKTKRLKTFSGG